MRQLILRLLGAANADPEVAHSLPLTLYDSAGTELSCFFVCSVFKDHRTATWKITGLKRWMAVNDANESCVAELRHDTITGRLTLELLRQGAAARGPQGGPAAPAAAPAPVASPRAAAAAPPDAAGGAAAPLEPGWVSMVLSDGTIRSLTIRISPFNAIKLFPALIDAHGPNVDIPVRVVEDPGGAVFDARLRGYNKGSESWHIKGLKRWFHKHDLRGEALVALKYDQGGQQVWLRLLSGAPAAAAGGGGGAGPSGGGAVGAGGAGGAVSGTAGTQGSRGGSAVGGMWGRGGGEHEVLAVSSDEDEVVDDSSGGAADARWGAAGAAGGRLAQHAPPPVRVPSGNGGSLGAARGRTPRSGTQQHGEATPVTPGSAAAPGGGGRAAGADAGDGASPGHGRSPSKPRAQYYSAAARDGDLRGFDSMFGKSLTNSDYDSGRLQLSSPMLHPDGVFGQLAAAGFCGPVMVVAEEGEDSRSWMLTFSSKGAALSGLRKLLGPIGAQRNDVLMFRQLPFEEHQQQQGGEPQLCTRFSVSLWRSGPGDPRVRQVDTRDEGAAHDAGRAAAGGPPRDAQHTPPGLQRAGSGAGGQAHSSGGPLGSLPSTLAAAASTGAGGRAGGATPSPAATAGRGGRSGRFVATGATPAAQRFPGQTVPGAVAEVALTEAMAERKATVYVQAGQARRLLGPAADGVAPGFLHAFAPLLDLEQLPAGQPYGSAPAIPDIGLSYYAYNGRGDTVWMLKGRALAPWLQRCAAAAGDRLVLERFRDGGCGASLVRAAAAEAHLAAAAGGEAAGQAASQPAAQPAAARAAGAAAGEAGAKRRRSREHKEGQEQEKRSRQPAAASPAGPAPGSGAADACGAGSPLAAPGGSAPGAGPGAAHAGPSRAAGTGAAADRTDTGAAEPVALPPAGRLPAASLAHLHGCVTRPPPLQPGELRVCGLTFHPSVAPAVRAALEGWRAGRALASCHPVKDQMAIPGFDKLGRLSAEAAASPQRWQAAFVAARLRPPLVLSQLSVALGFAGGWGNELPEGPLELAGVAPCEDARRGGRGLAAGAAGVRAGAVLGVVGGYVLPAPEATALASAGMEQLPARLREELAGRVGDARAVWYPWQLLVEGGSAPFPAQQAEGLQEPLVLSQLGYGNMSALVNDPRTNPRAWQEDNDVGDPDQQEQHPDANCMVLPVCVRGLVLPVLVALRDIAPGQQLLRDYGAAWWEELAMAWELAEDALEGAGGTLQALLGGAGGQVPAGPEVEPAAQGAGAPGGSVGGPGSGVDLGGGSGAAPAAHGAGQQAGSLRTPSSSRASAPPPSDAPARCSGGSGPGQGGTAGAGHEVGAGAGGEGQGPARSGAGGSGGLGCRGSDGAAQRSEDGGQGGAGPAAGARAQPLVRVKPEPQDGGAAGLAHLPPHLRPPLPPQHRQPQRQAPTPHAAGQQVVMKQEPGGCGAEAAAARAQHHTSPGAKRTRGDAPGGGGANGASKRLGSSGEGQPSQRDGSGRSGGGSAASGCDALAAGAAAREGGQQPQGEAGQRLQGGQAGEAGQSGEGPAEVLWSWRDLV